MDNGKGSWVLRQPHLPPSQARIRGTDLTVGQVLERLSRSMSAPEISRAFPELPAGSVLDEVLQFASRALSDKKLKDRWDKAAVWVPAAATVVLALVGLYFTTLYQCSNQKIQRVQTFSQFMPYLTAKDEDAKQFAVSALNLLGDTSLAIEAAGSIPSPGTAIALFKIANEAKTTNDRKLASDAFTRVFAREINRAFLVEGQSEVPWYGLYSYLVFPSPPDVENRARYMQALEAFLDEAPSESVQMARQSSEPTSQVGPPGSSGPTGSAVPLRTTSVLDESLRMPRQSSEPQFDVGPTGPSGPTGLAITHQLTQLPPGQEMKGQLRRLNVTYLPTTVAAHANVSGDWVLRNYDFKRFRLLLEGTDTAGPLVVAALSPIGLGGRPPAENVLIKDLSAIPPGEAIIRFFQLVSEARSWTPTEFKQLDEKLSALRQ